MYVVKRAARLIETLEYITLEYRIKVQQIWVLGHQTYMLTYIYSVFTIKNSM